MSWPRFAAPGAAWWFLLAVPLIALYLLRLRRPRTQVTSLVLWQRLLEDQRVNSPFQRFRRNLLLWLQLLLLVLAVLAAMQPFVRASAVDAERTLVLLDRSASMAARETPDAPTRFEIARGRVAEWVDALRSDQQLAVIAFDRGAQLVVPFTGDRRALRQAVDDVAVAAVGSDLTEALQMAEAMSRSQRIDRVILLSDGNLPDQTDVDLPFPVDYQRIDGGGGNLGIGELSAQRDPGGSWRVFARVDGSIGGERRGTLEWWIDGERRGEEQVAVSAGRGQRLVVPIPGDTRVQLEVRLIAEGFDALPADDVAWLTLEKPRPLRAWVAAQLLAHRRALEAQDGVSVAPESASPTHPDGPLDLIVTDAAETAVPASVALHVGAVPPVIADLVTVVNEPDGVVEWSRAAPLLEHVELADLVLTQRVSWVGAAGIADLERRRLAVLVHGRSGPLVVERPVRPGDARAQHDYWILFDAGHSTLPYRVGFPVLLANLVREAARRSSLLDATASSTGVLALPPVAAGAAVRVIGPGGSERTLRADAAGTVPAIGAQEVGVYQVWTDGALRHTIGAALLDPHETTLAAIDAFRARDLTVDVDIIPAGVDRSLVPAFVWLALATLLAEWWFANRRVGVRG